VSRCATAFDIANKTKLAVVGAVLDHIVVDFFSGRERGKDQLGSVSQLERNGRDREWATASSLDFGASNGSGLAPGSNVPGHSRASHRIGEAGDGRGREKANSQRSGMGGRVMVKETVKVTRVSLAVVTALSTMLGVACNDNNNLVPLIATFVTVNAGSNGQTGTAGQLLALPISVHVTDQNSNALAGVSVAWAVVGAGGSVSVASSLTDSNGDATTAWTLGTSVGLDSLTASIATGASVTITATASAAGATLAKVSGDNQVVNEGAVSLPMVVKVANAGGTGIGAAGVAWSVDGGGTLSATATTTDANGLTSVTLTAPAVAGAVMTVTATAASGATQTFTLSTPQVNPGG
jgi:hypothetical protein